MVKMINRIGLIVVCMLLSFMASAQEKVQMADEMRNNGKIYVVVAVSLTILAGLFFYLIILDRKISRFEKNEIK